MPIPAGARQPRHLDPEHEADLAEADFGDQPLKAQASLDAGAGAPEIVVDDDDLLPQPAVLRRPIRERVLQPGRLLMALNLLNRGLADVDDRQTVLMAPENLVADQPLRAGPDPRPSSGVSSATWRSRIRCKAICPKSVAMRPCVRGAACSKSTPADRSSRDPSQRAERIALQTRFSAIRRVPSIYERHREWDIELAFKRLKTLSRIDCLPAKTDKGGRSWIYAHLILAIATDACSQDFLDSSP